MDNALKNRLTDMTDELEGRTPTSINKTQEEKNKKKEELRLMLEQAYDEIAF